MNYRLNFSFSLHIGIKRYPYLGLRLAGVWHFSNRCPSAIDSGDSARPSLTAHLAELASMVLLYSGEGEGSPYYCMKIKEDQWQGEKIRVSERWVDCRKGREATRRCRWIQAGRKSNSTWNRGRLINVGKPASYWNTWRNALQNIHG